MSKKIGKFLLLTAVAGAAAYGTYSYLQKKEKPASDDLTDDADDDFDDFSEDLDEEPTSGKERAYVPLNLDKAEALATEAIQKAKEVLTDSVQQVKETVKSVTESQSYHSAFTDLTSVNKDAAKEPVMDVDAKEAPASETDADTPAAKKEPDMDPSVVTEDIVAEEEEESTSPLETAASAVKSVSEAVEDSVEEFFDDEEDSASN